MASGSRTNTSKDLVIYEPTTWDLVYTGEEVNRPSKTVTNPPAWLIQLFSRLQKPEEDVKLLADPRNDEDAKEIDISHLRDYDETLSKNASELFWEITQDATLQNTLTQERFNMIVKDCQIFGHEIWTAIGGLRYNTIGKENTQDERMNRINTDLRLIKAGDDYWRHAVQSWAQGQGQPQTEFASDVERRIAEIRHQVEREQVNNQKRLEAEFRAELHKFEEQRKRDEERCKSTDALMAKRLQAAEDKLRKAKSSDAQTIFDTEMEAIRNFHIHTPSREAIPEIPEYAFTETGGNNNPPPPPKGHTKENP
jgi:hypothetical protein